MLLPVYRCRSGTEEQRAADRRDYRACLAARRRP
jgi:hypothetical protein